MRDKQRWVASAATRGAIQEAEKRGCQDEFTHWCKHLAVEYKCDDPDCPIPLALAELNKWVARECAELAAGIPASYEAPDNWARAFGAGRDNAAGAIRQRWGL